MLITSYVYAHTISVRGLEHSRNAYNTCTYVCTVTKILVRVKKWSGGPFLVAQIWSAWTTFGSQKWSGLTKNGPGLEISQYINRIHTTCCKWCETTIYTSASSYIYRLFLPPRQICNLIYMHEVKDSSRFSYYVHDIKHFAKYYSSITQ